MKTNFFAICTVLIFACSAFGQQVESQISPSDESIVVPGEIAPAEGSEGMMIESGMPLPMASSSIGTDSCCQVIPVNCCSNTIIPVIYQQQITSSPIPSTPTTPSPISSSIGSSSVLQTPITPTTAPAPIQQGSPFIQPNCCGSGQIIGNQVSSPMITSPTNPIISPTTPAPTNATSAINGSTVPSAVVPTTNSFEGTTWAEPSSSWYPATTGFNYGYNCCPQNRTYFRGGRFFGRWR